MIKRIPQVNQLSVGVLRKPLLPQTPLSTYTGELIGVKYLYSLTGRVLDSNNLEEKVDEGFKDFKEEEEEDCIHFEN